MYDFIDIEKNIKTKKMNNSGIIRHLKSLKKNDNTPNQMAKKSEGRISLLISLIAIFFTGLSIYFQFFYEKYDLRIYIISADFDYKSNFNYKIVYHNKSNQNATILRNTIVFYQDSTDIESKSIYFCSNEPKQSFNEEFDPVVLEENKQIFREVKQPINFKNVFSKKNINYKDTIRVSLAVGFINETGNYSTNYIPLGWVKLDSINQPENYSFNYSSYELLSTSYRTGTLRTVEKISISK